jgi:predicted transcriptional regulator
MRRSLSELGRRERQIMEILIRRGQASASDVLSDLPDPPSYSSVRSMLRLLEEKGFVRHEWEGPRHVFRPTTDPEQAKRVAVRELLNTFFDNSVESAVATLLRSSDKPLTEEQARPLLKLIEEARKRGARK